MARIRTIKPEFPHAESMGRVGRDARLLFIELWTICDDEGKCRAAPRMLASLLFPYDDDAPHLIDGWLAELAGEGCIELYAVDGAHYLRVVNWSKHQRIEKASASKFPDPSPNPREEIPRIKEGIKEGIKEREREATTARAGKLPSDWKPDEEDLAWATASRPDLGPALIAAETERFCNHAKANERTAHRWGPNWRNWISKAHPPKAPPARSFVDPSAATTVNSDSESQWRARLKAYTAGAFWLEGDWGPRPESGASRVPVAVLAEWQTRQIAEAA
jgi:hypothetical protein